MEDQETFLRSIRSMLKDNMEWCDIERTLTAPHGMTLMQYAAANCFLSAMMFLHARGCFWDESVCEIAAKHGQFVCLKYALDNGCPYNRDKIRKVCEVYGHTNCLTLV